MLRQYGPRMSTMEKLKECNHQETSERRSKRSMCRKSPVGISKQQVLWLSIKQPLNFHKYSHAADGSKRLSLKIALFSLAQCLSGSGISPLQCNFLKKLSWVPIVNKGKMEGRLRQLCYSRAGTLSCWNSIVDKTEM